MPKPVRVLVVDDHEILAGALGLLFSRHPVFELVGCAPDAERAVKIAEERDPHVVLLDMELAGVDGTRATRQIKAARPSTKIVAVTSPGDADAAGEVLAAGASACIEKTRPVEEILDLALRAAAGEISMRDASVATPARPPTDAARLRAAEARVGRLTARETEILQALAAGDSIATAAGRFGISPLTVENHVKSILAKLEVHSKVEAVTLAWRYGLAPAATRPS